ncbi:uncharacterized protein LOC134627566 [Pelmatolapia mariae]|uniref:uncharacterized protein LOC134627566 n=1 Tax=Pelmatolapia mariae TaxID=158779 RepID=UPI002FE6AEF0
MTKASTTEKNTLRVIIKQHHTENSSADREELEFEIAKQCPKAFHQIAYSTAKTTIRCDYPEDKYKSWIKFFCKGNNFSCEDSLSTKPYPKSSRTFTLSNISHGFNMSISNVSSQDDGISDVGIVLIIITGLVFLVVFILVYKRISFSKNRGANAALQHAKELKDCTYEEIQERPQQPDQPENALTSIYVTASIPTDVAASPHYDSINFQSCSDKAGGEALKPSSSACEYSTLTLSKCPTNPTITQPSRPAEENLYSGPAAALFPSRHLDPLSH